MRVVLLTILLASTIWLPVNAQVQVRGYMRQDGTYVQPYVRTRPDYTPLNNYSTQGNYNPYTGQAGTVVPQQQIYQPRQQFNPYAGAGMQGFR